MIEIVIDLNILSLVSWWAPMIITAFVIAIPISTVTSIGYLETVARVIIVMGVCIVVAYVIISLFTPTTLGIQMVNLSVGAP